MAAPLMFAASCTRPSVSACYPADETAETIFYRLRGMALGGTGTDSIERESSKLPRLTDTTQIYQILDSATCARAVEPYIRYVELSAEERSSPRAQRVYVFRVGEVLVVSNPHANPDGGEWSQHIVMDSAFRRLGLFMY